MKIIFLTIGFSLLAFGVCAKDFFPVDDAAKDKSFLEFRTALIRAVEKRDKNALLAIVSPDIKNSFGGNEGKQEFIKHWKLDGPEQSSIWKELGWILNHGGSFLEDSFCAPYIYSNWPEELDPFEYYFAISEKNVPLLSSNDGGSHVIKNLSYVIVKNIDQRFFETSGNDLILVESEKIKGFVQRSALRSSTAYRACFKKANSNWIMWALVEGD